MEETGGGVEAVVWKGQPVILKRSKDSSSGFLNVCKGRLNKDGQQLFYAKFAPEGAQGKQRTLPGSVYTDPSHSAAELAYYLAGHSGELPDKKQRGERRASEVCILCSL